MASALPRFERRQLVYKSLNGVEFEAPVLVSKPLAASKTQTNCPLLVHFHGGGLLLGQPLEPAFLSLWPLELAEAENAIIVSPAYRLLVEAKGADIIEDVNDFWVWVHTTLPSLISSNWPHLTLDLQKIAVFGESAGGYLSLQSAFLFPEAKIKVAIAEYPAMYPDIEQYKHANVADDPTEANAYIEKYLADIKPGTFRLSARFPIFLPFMQAVIASARHREFIGDDERMTLNHGLRVVENLVPIWVLQGTEDVIVPPKATDEMVARIKKAHPDSPLLYSVQPGGHGFDMTHSLNESYIAEGVEFVRKYWL